MKPAGKLAVVTGASSGIGAASARELSAAGARVVLMSRTTEALERVAGQIAQAGGEAHVVVVDVSDHTAVERAARETVAKLGVPDVIVHCAGSGRLLFIDETSPEELVSMTNVPYHGTFFVTKAFLPGMLERDSGTIVVVNPPAFAVWPGSLGYWGARFAMRGFTESLRADLRGTGLRVTAVCPGNVESGYDAHNGYSDSRLPKLTALSPQQSSEAVGRVVVRAIERDRRDVYTPLPIRLMTFQSQHFPRLTSWLLAKTGARRSEIGRVDNAR